MNSLQIGRTVLSLVQGDITDQDTEVIVNAANSTLFGGGGVDGAIHRRGGAAILAECRHIRATAYPAGLPTGSAVSTSAGELAARRVVHTVGPIWRGGKTHEADLLAEAYRNSLAVAANEGARTIAFPSISTGAYGYPTEQAAEVALRTVTEEIGRDHESFDEVRFVLFSHGDLAIYQSVLRSLSQELSG